MNNTRRSRQRHAWLTLCAAAIGVFAFAANPASAQCQYEVTAIIEGPPCWPSNFPAVLMGRGMNSYGHVVGSWQMCLETADEAFYWTPETGLVTMTRPAGVTSAIAYDINDHGQIVGGHQVNGVGWKGFVYDIKTQHYTYLEPLHAWPVPLHILSSLNAINNAGIAVGSRVISKPGVSPTVSNAVIWDTNTGEVIDLGVGDGPNSAGEDGTDSNGAGGWSGGAFYFSADARGLLWIKERVIELEVLPGMVQNSVRAVNNHLDAVGTSGDGTAGGTLRFLWLDGVMTEFLPPKGYDRAIPSDINDSRQIVGSMRIQGTSTFHPYLWQYGVFHDLRDLIVRVPPNLTITGASEIGNGGRIRAGGTGIGNVALVLAPVGQPTADFDHNCRVDVRDLLILLDAWGPILRAKRQTASPADLNEDGVVDVSDLLILLANWSI